LAPSYLVSMVNGLFVNHDMDRNDVIFSVCLPSTMHEAFEPKKRKPNSKKSIKFCGHIFLISPLIKIMIDFIVKNKLR